MQPKDCSRSCLLILWSVHCFGPDWNTSSITGSTGFCAGSRGPQKMQPNDFGDPLTFSFSVTMKYLFFEQGCRKMEKKLTLRCFWFSARYMGPGACLVWRIDLNCSCVRMKPDTVNIIRLKAKQNQNAPCQNLNQKTKARTGRNFNRLQKCSLKPFQKTIKIKTDVYLKMLDIHFQNREVIKQAPKQTKYPTRERTAWSNINTFAHIQQLFQLS